MSDGMDKVGVNHGGVTMDTDGLSVFSTAVVVMGELAGAGVLALPNAMNGSGFIGPVVITFVCVAAIYTGWVLGKCWVLVQQRYPEYRDRVRYPYSAIGEVTYGYGGRVFVSVAVTVTLYGTTVVFILLAAQNTHDMMKHYIDISFCYWLIVVAVVVTPMTWLGSPKDFWIVALLAISLTIAAVLLLLTDMILDIPFRHTARHDSPTLGTFALAFGTILFAFGGHAAFPTIQNDMSDQKKFGRTICIGYLSVLVIYLPITILAYLIYGKDSGDNVLLAMPDGPMQVMTEAFFTCHLVFAYIIVINPVSQDVEEILNLPKEFTWKRALCRTSLVVMCVITAATVPKFRDIMTLFGGSTMNLLSFILPVVFYMKLASMEGDWPKITIPLHQRVLNYEIIIIGILGGLVSSYAAIVNIISPDALTLPCFLHVTQPQHY